jgi:hypothetical protein
MNGSHAARPIPRWLPPVGGLLFALGFVGLGVSATWRSWGYLVAALACLTSFLAVVVYASRAGGITPWPSGSYRQRAVRQLPAVVVLLAGAVAAFPFGVTGFTVVVGVGLGAVAWAQLARARGGRV